MYLRDDLGNPFFEDKDYRECVSSYLTNQISANQLIGVIEARKQRLKPETRFVRSMVFQAFHRSISHLPYNASGNNNNYRAVMISKIYSFIGGSKQDKYDARHPKDQVANKQSPMKLLAMYGFILVMFVEAGSFKNMRRPVEEYIDIFAREIPIDDKRAIAEATRPPRSQRKHENSGIRNMFRR